MKETAIKGGVGMFATGTGLAVSQLAALPAWCHWVSWGIGAAVGLAMFASIVQKISHNRRRRDGR